MKKWREPISKSISQERTSAICAFPIYQLKNISDEEYINHQEKKEQARISKKEDKDKAISNPKDIAAFCVDVQAVKLAPVLQASAIYYKTKLCVHNYTIYNMATKDVICYLWDESQGGLEANIFSTILTEFFSNYLLENNSTKEFIIYSDGCGYQNKNVTLSNALLHFAIKNEVTITHNYLQKGHTQMEVDSVHSTIERRLKNRDIYLPHDYIAVCKEARRGQPYNVRYMSYRDFKDFKNIQFYPSIRPGRKPGEPLVTDVCSYKYSPTGEILYKINFTDNYKALLKRTTVSNKISLDIPLLYKSQPKIKKEKYDHLQNLKIVLDKKFWDFYDNLPH